MIGGRAAVLQAINMAVGTVERVRQERWVSFSGESLEPQLAVLARTLRGMRDQEAQGEPIREQEVIDNLLRFVGDWIPDASHPLLKQLGAILSAVEAGG